VVTSVLALAMTSKVSSEGADLNLGFTFTTDGGAGLKVQDN
jgi:hypothetical protein